jgi:hypothetical protein
LERNPHTEIGGVAIFTQHRLWETRHAAFFLFRSPARRQGCHDDRRPSAGRRHRKPRYVLMTYDEYQAMTKARVNPRRVFGPGETPAELAEMILPELDKLIEEGA